MITIKWHHEYDGTMLFCYAYCDCGEWQSPARLNPREVAVMAGAHIATAHYPGRHRGKH